MSFKAIGLGLSLVIGLATIGRGADEPKPLILDVWPGPAPGEDGSIKEEKIDHVPGQSAIRGITNVTKPTLTVYRADKANDTGATVIVCPGGG